PGVGGGVVQPDGGVLEFDAATPLVAVPQRCPGEAHEAPVSHVEDVGPIHAAAARRRGVWEALLPAAGGQVVGEQGKPLRDTVVTPEMKPLAVVRVIVRTALPAEARDWCPFPRALLNPLVFRVAGPIGLLIRRLPGQPDGGPEGGPDDDGGARPRPDQE